MDKPGKIVRNQIYFILVNKRFRNSCKTVRTYPGADINSDLVALGGVFKIRLKKVKKETRQRYDLRRLKEPNIKQEVKIDLNNRISTEDNTNNIQQEIADLKNSVLKLKEKYLKPDKRKRKSWMTEDILNLIERRINKGNTVEYKRIQKIIRRKIRKAKEEEHKEKCDEIEFYQSRFDSFNVHKKVREITEKCKKKGSGKLMDEMET